MTAIANERRPVEELLQIYKQLQSHGWKIELICRQSEVDPIYAYLSPATVKADVNKPINTFWILGGVHGEEPAPQEAFANELQTFITLGKTIPIILMPMLNPKARRVDWRYENEYRDFTIGQSVTDSEHLLRPDYSESPSDTDRSITQWVLDTSKHCPPLLVFDHHEDRVPEQFPEGDPRNIKSCYVYISRDDSVTMQMALMTIKALKSAGMPIADSGSTRFGEEIKKGIIIDSADGSIDEFFGSDTYIDPQTKSVCHKQPAGAVLVVETTIPFDGSISIDKRIAAHQAIIQQYSRMWSLANREI